MQRLIAARPGHALLLVVTLLSLAGCSTYGDRVAPLPVPGQQANAVTVNGAAVVARAYIDRDAASGAFGFDVRKAGLLPVQFVLDNQSGQPVSISSREALLIDNAGNAWPILSGDKATTRVRETVRAGESIASGAKTSLLTGLAGAIAGAAIGVVTGGDVTEATGRGAAAGAAVGALGGGAKRYAEIDREVSQDMLERSLTQRAIAPGALAHGFLFFPGKDTEAASVQSLRLTLKFEDETRAISVPVSPVPRR